MQSLAPFCSTSSCPCHKDFARPSSSFEALSKIEMAWAYQALLDEAGEEVPLGRYKLWVRLPRATETGVDIASEHVRDLVAVIFARGFADMAAAAKVSVDSPMVAVVYLGEDVQRGDTDTREFADVLKRWAGADTDCFLGLNIAASPIMDIY